MSAAEQFHADVREALAYAESASPFGDRGAAVRLVRLGDGYGVSAKPPQAPDGSVAAAPVMAQGASPEEAFANLAERLFEINEAAQAAGEAAA